MAIRWAIANGNWSSTASWNGFTLPTSSDDVYSDGKSITIDQNIWVNTLDTRQRTGGISAGSFLVTNTNGLFITASNIISGNSNCLTVTLSSGQNCNIFSNITNATYSTYGLVTNGGNVNLTGTVSCGSRLTGSGTYYSFIVQNGTMNMNGNIIAATSSSVSSGFGGYISNSTLYLTGNIIGGSGSSCVGLYMINNASIYATGSITGGTNVSCHGLYSLNNSTVHNLNGNISAGSGNSAYGTLILGAGIASHIGNISGGSGVSAFGFYIGPATSGQTFNGSLTFSGSIWGGTNTTTCGLYLERLSGTSTINGPITGGTGSNAWGLYTNGLNNITINGTVSATGAYGLRLLSQGTVTINGRVLSSNSNFGVYHDGSSNLIVNGTQSSMNPSIYTPIYKLSTAGNLTVNGSILGSTSSSTLSVFIYDDSLSTTTINGDIINGNFGHTNGLIILTRGASLNVNGNVSAGTVANSLAINSSPSSAIKINILGNVTGGGNSTNCPAIALNTANQILTITGSVIAGSSFPAIISPQQSSKTIVHGNLVNTSDIMAYYGFKLNLGNTQSAIWTIQSASGSNRAISSSNVSNGLPSVGNVRSGVSFGTVGEFTGTLAVPTASSVSYGVPVDNTVGTAVLNVADMGALLAGFVV